MPEDITTFTDASIWPASPVMLGIGSFASWEPGSQRAHTALELILAHAGGDVAKGRGLLAAACGPNLGTGRVELAAVVLALFQPSPLRLATDAAYVIAIWRNWLRGRYSAGSTPLPLIRDGDIIASFVKVATKRGGSRTFSINKVKAHTTEEDLEAGIITQFERDNNDEVDGLAKKARQYHDTVLVDYVAWAKHRVKAYRRFALMVQRMFVDIGVRAEELYNAQRKAGALAPTPRTLTNGKALITYYPPRYPTFAQVGRGQATRVNLAEPPPPPK